MNPPNGVARILLIADDHDDGLLYRNALAAGGYHLVQAESFIEAFDSAMTDPDVIVLCDLAMFAYPAQNAQVLRIPDEMPPAARAVHVHRLGPLRVTPATP